MHEMVAGIIRTVPSLRQALLDGARQRFDEQVRRYVGLGLDETIERVPSFVTSSVRQTIACFRPEEKYSRRGQKAVMLVPGLFCMPSVFNRLGIELQDRGLDVYLPRPFPLGYWLFANTFRVDQTVEALLEDLERLRDEGLESLSLAGHSLGGIIVVRALQKAESEGRRIPQVDKVVAIASPLRGAPIAALLRSLVPACRDIAPGAKTLTEIEPALERVTDFLVSDFDLLVPFAANCIDSSKSTVLPRIQHSDFYVGTPEEVALTADTLFQILTKDSSGAAAPDQSVRR